MIIIIIKIKRLDTILQLARREKNLPSLKAVDGLLLMARGSPVHFAHAGHGSWGRSTHSCTGPCSAGDGSDSGSCRKSTTAGAPHNSRKKERRFMADAADSN